MKLCYRDISYDYQMIEIKVRGNSSVQSRSYCLQGQRTKRYCSRGVKPNKARRIKFLSLLCDKNSLVIKIAIKAARYLDQVSKQDFAPQIHT